MAETRSRSNQAKRRKAANAFEYYLQVTTMNHRDRVTKLEICRKHNWDDISETQRQKIIAAAYADCETAEDRRQVDEQIRLDRIKREANRVIKPKHRRR